MHAQQSPQFMKRFSLPPIEKVSALTSEECALLLQAIGAYQHNPNYRAVHEKIAGKVLLTFLPQSSAV